MSENTNNWANGQEGPPENVVPPALVERFRSWAAEVLRDEAPPEGIPAGLLSLLVHDEYGDTEVPASMDVYRLWSAMIALTQEAKLQGRAFKQLGDALEPVKNVKNLVDELADSHEEALAEARRIANEALRQRSETDRDLELKAQREGQRALLSVLIDMRDRLIRGLQSAQAHRKNFGESLKPHWLDRLLGRAEAFRKYTEAGEALEKGYTLSLDRLEETLDRLGIHEVPCLGRIFDPETMVAVDIADTDEAPAGTVVEVYKTGYLWNGELFHTAQVKVVRARQTGQPQSEKGKNDGE